MGESPFGRPGSHPFMAGWPGMRAQRGMLNYAVLVLLTETPMHGYEIIRKLEERSHGCWRPSAGSVYPILQMLEEQALVTSSEEGGKKIYTLTKAGEEAAKKHSHTHAPWSNHASPDRLHAFHETAHQIKQLIHTVKRVASIPDNPHQKEIQTILTEATQKLAALSPEQ